MVKCYQVGCEEQGFKYDWYDGYLCPHHAKEVADILRKERRGREQGWDWEDCNYCRGAYDEQGNYNPAQGKVFGRFNKKTQECDFFGCKYYPTNRNRGGSRNPKPPRKEVNHVCDQCGQKINGSYYYNSLVNDDKKICSEECYAIFYGVDCDKCKQRIKTTEKCYYKDAKNKTGTLCASCYQTKKKQDNSSTSEPQSEKTNTQQSASSSNLSPDSTTQDSDNANNNDSSDGNSSPSSIPSNHFSNTFSNHDNSSAADQSFLNCDFCKSSYSSEQEHNNQSPNCQQWEEIAQKALANIERGMLNEHSKLDKLPSEHKNILIALQELKINKQWVDIDNLDISETNKPELRKIREELGIKKESNSFNDQSRDFSGEYQKESPIGPKILMFGGLIVILTAIVIYGVKRSRNKRLKLKRK